MREGLSSGFVDGDLSIRIVRAEVFVLRTPCDTPVRTSFGIMQDRPAVYLRLEASDGVRGLGEVWCNFPGCGAEHRARLLETVIFPVLLEGEYESPAVCFAELDKRLERLAIQAGEEGPIAQCLAGIDGALWDLVAKRAEVPCFRMLGGQHQEIGVYASGINPTDADKTVARCRAEGFTAFKLKIGFGDDVDLENLSNISADLRDKEQLMADVNQGWTVAKAVNMMPRLMEFPLSWLEEPILATSSTEDWNRVSTASNIPLAAGENMMGQRKFKQTSRLGIFSVLQPDLCKWGGISGTFPVAQDILKAGLRYCPHFLGGGIGLAASAHVLAAVGGDGLLEIDSNPNPLRENLFSPKITAGRIAIAEEPGSGISNEQFTTFLNALPKNAITIKAKMTK